MPNTSPTWMRCRRCRNGGDWPQPVSSRPAGHLLPGHEAHRRALRYAQRSPRDRRSGRRRKMCRHARPPPHRPRKWREETNDLGLIPEAELNEQRRPGGKWSVTADPTTTLEQGQLTIRSTTEGASIAYRMGKNLPAGAAGRWLLYTGPIKIAPGTTLQTKACASAFAIAKSSLGCWNNLFDSQGRDLTLNVPPRSPSFPSESCQPLLCSRILAFPAGRCSRRARSACSAWA